MYLYIFAIYVVSIRRIYDMKIYFTTYNFLMFGVNNTYLEAAVP